jgi:hypothetical protein
MFFSFSFTQTNKKIPGFEIVACILSPFCCLFTDLIASEAQLCGIMHANVVQLARRSHVIDWHITAVGVPIDHWRFGGCGDVLDQ